MKKLFDLKFIFIVVFLLLTIAIKNSENFQLRDFDDGVSESSSSKAVRSKQSTKIRFPFRKLEKLEESAEELDDDDDDEDEEDDDDEKNSEEDTTDYRFTKVRKPTFELKKPTNMRNSKLAQFRESPKDFDDESEEKISFFTRILNFFKRKPNNEEDESESEENTKDEPAEASGENDDDDDDDSENKPLLNEIFDKFKDFLEARNKQNQAIDEDESSGDSSSEKNDDDQDDDSSGDDEKPDEIEKKSSQSKIKISIKETLATIFNRKPFNLIFDFDDDDENETKVLEDSEEDEINYQRLLKEERENLQQHVDQLIKQSSEEDSKVSEPETLQIEGTKAAAKPKKDKKSREEAHLAQKEFAKLLLNLPSFVPDYSKVKNPECQKQGEVFQRQLRGQRIWALQMMDANAKIPSGLMRGNTNQLGDFDLCTKISQKIKISETNSMKMKGKYCLANIDFVAAADQLKLPVHLIQGRNFIRSTINDVSNASYFKYRKVIYDAFSLITFFHVIQPLTGASVCRRLVRTTTPIKFWSRSLDPTIHQALSFILMLMKIVVMCVNTSISLIWQNRIGESLELGKGLLARILVCFFWKFPKKLLRYLRMKN